MAEGVGLLRGYPLILLGLLCHTKLLIFWDNYIWERQLNPTKNCELYMIRKPKDNKISGNSIGNPCIQLQHLFGDSRKNNFRQIYGGIAREKGMHGSLLSNKYSEEESVQNVYDLGWADTRPQGMERCQPWSQETGTISTAITEDSKLYWAENICELGCHQKCFLMLLSNVFDLKFPAMEEGVSVLRPRLPPGSCVFQKNKSTSADNRASPPPRLPENKDEGEIRISWKYRFLWK